MNNRPHLTFVSLLCFSISLPIIYSRTVGGDKRLDGWRVRDNIGREVGKEKEKGKIIRSPIQSKGQCLVAGAPPKSAWVSCLLSFLWLSEG